MNTVTDTTNTKNSVTNVDHLPILLQGKLLPAKKTDYCSGRVKKQLKAQSKINCRFALVVYMIMILLTLLLVLMLVLVLCWCWR